MNELDSSLLQHKHATRKLEIGYMGHIFGAGAEKPGNIAAAVIMLSIAVLVGVLIWGPDTGNFPKKRP